MDTIGVMLVLAPFLLGILIILGGTAFLLRAIGSIAISVGVVLLMWIFMLF